MRTTFVVTSTRWCAQLTATPSTGNMEEKDALYAKLGFLGEADGVRAPGANLPIWTAERRERMRSLCSTNWCYRRVPLYTTAGGTVANLKLRPGPLFTIRHISEPTNLPPQAIRWLETSCWIFENTVTLCPMTVTF